MTDSNTSDDSEQETSDDSPIPTWRHSFTNLIFTDLEGETIKEFFGRSIPLPEKGEIIEIWNYTRTEENGEPLDTNDLTTYEVESLRKVYTDLTTMSEDEVQDYDTPYMMVLVSVKEVDEEEEEEPNLTSPMEDEDKNE